MTYGLQIFDGAGVKTFDTTVTQGGWLADVVNQTSTSSVTKTYPNFPDRSVFVMTVSGYVDVSIATDTALGYPRVTFPPGHPTYPINYLVFAV